MRPGAALPMVLLSLGLVAALSVGGSFVTRRYAADARLRQASLELEPLVEAALVGSVGGLDSAQLASLAVGATAPITLPVTFGAPKVVTRAWVTRLDSAVFALVGEAEMQHKQLLLKRLRLVVMSDSSGFRPVPLGSWSRLP